MRLINNNGRNEKETNMEYTVRYSEHDAGAKDGMFIRESRQIAERSARLLKECGYRKVEVKAE
jgi:hypothetical protein